MAQPDIAGLLTGIGSAPIDPMQGASIRDREIALQQQGLAGLRQGIGALTGGRVDARNPAEKAKAALAGLDPSKKEDQDKIIEIISRVAPERVPALKAQFAQRGLKVGRTADFATFITAKYGEQYGKLAREGVLTPENMDDFITDLQLADNQKGSTYTAKDSQGNDYTMIVGYNKRTGRAENSYSPVSPNAPAIPVGKVEITGGEFAQTAGERAALEVQTAGQKEQETTYQEKRVEMVAMLPELKAKHRNLTSAEALLDSVPTGGPVNLVGTGLEKFFGETSQDKAELELSFGLEMLKSLKPFFGGIISDSEAARLDNIYASLKKGSAANKGILKVLKRELDDAMAKAAMYQRAKTFKDFDTTMGIMFTEEKDKEDVGTEVKRIDFLDLK